jgi:hypothetical protein
MTVLAKARIAGRNMADVEAVLAGRTVILATHADLPSGLWIRTLVLNIGRLEEMP